MGKAKYVLSNCFLQLILFSLELLKTPCLVCRDSQRGPDLNFGNH